MNFKEWLLTEETSANLEEPHMWQLYIGSKGMAQHFLDFLRANRIDNAINPNDMKFISDMITNNPIYQKILLSKDVEAKFKLHKDKEKMANILFKTFKSLTPEQQNQYKELFDAKLKLEKSQFDKTFEEEKIKKDLHWKELVKMNDQDFEEFKKADMNKKLIMMKKTWQKNANKEEWNNLLITHWAKPDDAIKVITGQVKPRELSATYYPPNQDLSKTMSAWGGRFVALKLEGNVTCGFMGDGQTDNYFLPRDHPNWEKYGGRAWTLTPVFQNNAWNEVLIQDYKIKKVLILPELYKIQTGKDAPKEEIQRVVDAAKQNGIPVEFVHHEIKSENKHYDLIESDLQRGQLLNIQWNMSDKIHGELNSEDSHKYKVDKIVFPSRGKDKDCCLKHLQKARFMFDTKPNDPERGAIIADPLPCKECEDIKKMLPAGSRIDGKNLFLRTGEEETVHDLSHNDVKYHIELHDRHVKNNKEFDEILEKIKSGEMQYPQFDKSKPETIYWELPDLSPKFKDHYVYLGKKEQETEDEIKVDIYEHPIIRRITGTSNYDYESPDGGARSGTDYHTVLVPWDEVDPEVKKFAIDQKNKLKDAMEKYETKVLPMQLKQKAWEKSFWEWYENLSPQERKSLKIERDGYGVSSKNKNRSSILDKLKNEPEFKHLKKQELLWGM